MPLSTRIALSILFTQIASVLERSHLSSSGFSTYKKTIQPFNCRRSILIKNGNSEEVINSQRLIINYWVLKKYIHRYINYLSLSFSEIFNIKFIEKLRIYI